MSELVAAPPGAPARRGARWLAVPLVAFAIVSLTAGFLASREPSGGGYFDLIFSDPIHMKVWLATAAAVPVPALYRRMDLPQAAVVEAGVGQPRPPLVGTAGVGRNAAGGVPLHLQARRPGKRFSQTINTFAASAPKNAHPSSEWTATRVDASWTLPVAGGLLFAVLIGVRWASARWFFDTVGVGF